MRENAVEALQVLDSCLPRNKYIVEVVTDNVVDVVKSCTADTSCFSMDAEVLNTNYTEIVVPTDFICPSGAKYKARALHYAILFSQATDTDWVVHLDEETRFTVETVRYCLNHCVEQDAELARGTKQYANIGQGVIVYGNKMSIENYWTTLADSIRVGDDFGKFRIQYESHYPWIGMHGSFVVCHNAVEKAIGFDNGLNGSITEDTYFALLAWEKDIQFSWVDGYMYEQSPFSIYDFLMQRRRWFGGVSECRRSSRCLVR